ncbi:MAG: site-specific DNA-methyltransferase [Chitinophagaceae bacterium]|nr:site-specific DNA-methyltransferase [Chitinophagaceae bacterium]
MSATTQEAPASISSRILKAKKIKWEDLQFIQQEDFKEWIDTGDLKLVQSLLKYNFIDPFKVWENKGVIYCLDGYHRCADLKKIKESGVNVPELLDATFIDCESIEDAAELVLVYSSIYAKITQVGFDSFIKNYELNLSELKETISIPEFSMDRFEQKYNVFNTDNAEEPEVEVTEDDLIVKPGDLFEINGHRIICDSFKNDDSVKLLMNGNKARIVNCDPPYNLPANFFTNKEEKRHKDFAMGAGEMTDDEFVGFISDIMRRSIENTVKGAIHYIFMDWRHVWHMTEAARLVYGSPQPKQLCVWNKDMMANGSFYRAKHELCFVFNSPQAKAIWNKDMLDHGGFYKNNDELVFIFKNGGDDVKHLSHLDLRDRIRTNVWNYPSATSTANSDKLELKNHPTPKPVVMIADAILDTTNEKDIVIDWFLGSGTSLIAAQQTKRLCYATEIEPKYLQGDIIRFLNFCDKRGIEVNFSHVNGILTLKDFQNEQSKTQNNV